MRTLSQRWQVIFPKPHSQGRAGWSPVPDLWIPKPVLRVCWTLTHEPPPFPRPPAARSRVPRNGSLTPSPATRTLPQDSETELLGISVSWYGWIPAVRGGPGTWCVGVGCLAAGKGLHALRPRSCHWPVFSKASLSQPQSLEVMTLSRRVQQ